MTDTALVTFKKTAIAKTGNDFIKAMLMHDSVKQAAEQAVAEASTREGLIDWELTRLAMMLHEKEEIDVYHVFENKQITANLYKSILLAAGIYKRDIVDDKVVYFFTDTEVDQALSWDNNIAGYKHDPEKERNPKYSDEDIAMHKARRARRNSLNLRLAKACQAASKLIAVGATVDNLIYKDGNPVLTKGPQEIMGKEKEVVIQTGRTAVGKAEGATSKPAIGAIANLAKAENKAQNSASEEGAATDRTTKGDTTVVSEKDFLAMSNALLMAIKRREGVFSDAEKTSMANLKNFL